MSHGPRVAISDGSCCRRLLLGIVRSSMIAQSYCYYYDYENNVKSKRYTIDKAVAF